VNFLIFPTISQTGYGRSPFLRHISYDIL